MKNEEEQVTISAELYEELKEDSKLLRALQAAGVDNWDGYDHALDILDSWSNLD